MLNRENDILRKKYDFLKKNVYFFLFHVTEWLIGAKIAMNY